VIDERLMAPGAWDVTLKDGTPPSLLERLRCVETHPQTLGAATLVVTAAHLNPDSIGTGDTGTAFHPLFDAALYTGVVNRCAAVLRGKVGSARLDGYGMAWHLGTPEDTGELWVGNAMTSSSNNARIFTESTHVWFDWLGMGGTQTASDGSGATVTLRPCHLYDSNAFTIGSAIPYFPEPMTRREALNRISNHAGWLWYITPQMVLRAGLPGDLFPDGPRAIVSSDIGSDPTLLTYATEEIGWEESLDNYRNKRVSFDDNGGTYPPVSWAYPNSTPPSGDYYGPDGTLLHIVERDDHLQDENILEWGARQIAEVPAGQHARRALTVTGWPNREGVNLIPGEPVWVHEPLLGLVDTGNEVRAGGQTLHPTEVDLYGVTWPVIEGMGVYVVFYDQDTSTLETLDLTPHVAYETGPTTLDVGAPHRVL
jgi:hypothetical protein